MITNEVTIEGVKVSYVFDDFQEFMLFFLATSSTPEQEIKIKELMASAYGGESAKS